MANNSTPNTFIFLYVALPCEAKPLVKHFNLKKETAIKAFAIYQNSKITLTVSGLGKSAMAAAVAYSQALYGKSPNAVFLNIGIAGHKTHSLEKAFCIEKIIDSDTGRNFYPQLVANLPCPTQTLCTVSIAINSYPENYLYDMEGSAFYQIAVRFSSSELVQCLKVVSDNETSNIENIDIHLASKIIFNSIGVIEKLLSELVKLAATIEHSETDLYLQFISKWHFSSSNQIRLKKLLSKWQIITDNSALPTSTMACNNSKEFLLKLEYEIEHCDYSL
jgi:nucleoside phosphorylase